MCKIAVQVPATSANCGPGFDTIGLALELYNTFVFECVAGATEYTFSFEGLGADLMEKEDEKNNLVVKAMLRIFEEAKMDPLYGHIHCKVEVPPARGLGSSSTAIVAGLFLANAVVKEPFTKDRLLAIGTEMEGHPDNVCPAILGNLCCAVMEKGQLFYHLVDLSEGLTFAVVVPEILVSTEDARKALPKMIPHHLAAKNGAHLAFLLLSLEKGKFEELHMGLEDYLHVPYRKLLIPHYDEVSKAALSAGAKGVTISGSGSTIIAYCTDKTKEVAEAMAAAFVNNGVRAKPYVLRANREGTTYVQLD